MNREPSPANVGDYIKVSTVSTGVILVAMSVLAAGFIFWCFFGTITDKEHIKGIVFPSEITSGVKVPNDGTVRNILVHKGDVVKKGQNIAIISVLGSYSILSAPCNGKVLSFIPENENFKAFENIISLLSENSCGTVFDMIAFAGYNSSRLIKPGQEIQATPMSETREKVGFVKGRISSVSPYPVSRLEAVAKLQNASLVDDLFPDSGSAFLIRIELSAEEGHPENLIWSFPLKESVDMSVGTCCSIDVITKSRSIFQYLMENVQETRNSVKLWSEN